MNTRPPEATAAQIAEWDDYSRLSDGYHTFAELYEHRYSLMLALMRAVPNLCWFSQRHSDGELPFGSREWFIVGANFSTGQISYHLPIAMLALARKTGAIELTTGRPWDGHTADDVIQRLREWATAPAGLPSGDARAVKESLTSEAPPDGHFRDATEMAQPPVEGEVAELVAWLRSRAAIPASPDFPAVADRLRHAADLLERQAAPVPVAVSERLPEAEDCDAEERCWLLAPRWILPPAELTHWLPAHALPLPSGEATNG